MPVAACVQVRHQDLKAAHDQLALNLQDHKSALAAAQVGQLCLLCSALVLFAAEVSHSFSSALDKSLNIRTNSVPVYMLV